MAHKSTWFFLHQIRDFSGRTNRIFWWIHPDVDCGSLYSNARRGCRSTAGLSAICRVLHLSGSLTLGQWFGEVGPTPGGNLGWKECKLNAAGAELSQHQRHKHTVSGRTEGCKYRGEGRGGGRDVVCLVIWSWRQELWIRKCCDTPHEYATSFRESLLNTRNITGLGCLLTITMTTFALRSGSQKTTTESFELIY